MATVDNPKMVADIIRNNGVYRSADGDDPQCYAVLSYENDFGATAYSLCYDTRAAASVKMSPHCRDVKLLWTQDGITPDGRDFLEAIR